MPTWRCATRSLATLLDGESSGYDLAKTFDSAVANFWMAAPQQLYRELERWRPRVWSRRGWSSRRGALNKRVFDLTAAGRDALVEFTTAEMKAPAIRDGLLVQVQAVDVADADVMLGNIAQRLDLAAPDCGASNGCATICSVGKPRRCSCAPRRGSGPT